MRRSFVGACLCTGAILLAACGGDETTAPPPAETPAIAFTQVGAAGVTVPVGTSTTLTFLIRRSAYPGPLTLTVDSLPPGVRAVFFPAQLGIHEDSTTLAIIVTPSAEAGTGVIAVRATGQGVVTPPTLVPLTITVPAASLTLGTRSATATLDGSVVVPVSIARSGGFEGSVALTASGVPSGVTATFAPALLERGVVTSSLTLTPSLGATLGASTVTVTAAGAGIATQTSSVELTIVDAARPVFRLETSPSALLAVHGQAAERVVHIARAGGFTGAVMLALEGAPAGMIATFVPESAAGEASTLTISAPASVAAGTYNVTVRGAAAGLPSQTLPLTVVVQQPPGIQLVVDPEVTLARGQSTQFSIELTRLGTFSSAVYGSVEGVPPGVTVTLPEIFVWFPVVLRANFAGTITVAPEARAGVYELTFRAVGTTPANPGTARMTLTVTDAR